MKTFLAGVLAICLIILIYVKEPNNKKKVEEFIIKIINDFKKCLK
jgi:hypothetical protein